MEFVGQVKLERQGVVGIAVTLLEAYGADHSVRLAVGVKADVVKWLLVKGANAVIDSITHLLL